MALDVNGNYLTVQVNKDTEVVSTDNSVHVSRTDEGNTKIFNLSVRPDGNSHWVNGTAEGSVRLVTSAEEEGDYHLGEGAVAEGIDTFAEGTASHAEGGNCRASGDYSHAEGNSCYATGIDSHAEGFANNAVGSHSHVEGQSNNALGLNSHAEGFSTNAEGENSHAEGQSTHTVNYAAHAEGYETEAKSPASHAEGYQTIAAGNYGFGSHAEGYQSVAGGTATHAEGYRTVCYDYGHSEGFVTIAVGNSASHAEGGETISTGTYAHAEGEGGNPYEDIVFSIVSYDSDNNNLLVDGDLRIFLNQANNFMPLVSISWSGQSDKKPLFFANFKSYEESTNQTILGLQRIIPYEAFSELPTSEDNITHISIENHGALNVNSHTEGQFTCAYGACSHAEGIGTKTTNEGEHAGGWLNESIRNAYDGREVYEEHGTLFSLGNGYVERVGDERVVHRRNAFDIRFDGSIYAPQVKQGAGTLQNLSLDANGQIVIGSAGGGSMTEVTASELRTLIADSELKAGAFYRVTDYQCTRTDFSNSQNATHQFDIVLLALDANTLNQKGWCIRHAGDSYFSSVHMEQWQVWFDIALDTYGRVLRLIDENRNDCPYDFKNVLWLDFDVVAGNVVDGTDYLYTFNLHDNDTDSDLSIVGSRCFSNVFGEKSYRNIYKNTSTSDDCHSNTLGTESYNNVFLAGCNRNTFGDNCNGNALGYHFRANQIGHMFSRNIFTGSTGAHFNIFGSEVTSNTYGTDFSYNHIEGNCTSNTFGDYCTRNILGWSCSSNTFGVGCRYNILSNSCNYITLGESCYDNTFGSGCFHIIFGNSTTTKNYYRNIIIDSGNQYIYLDCTGTLSDSSRYQNVHIGLGVNNTTTYKTITDANVNQTYQTEYLPTGSQTINV